jgi:hypothetical protein
LSSRWIRGKERQRWRWVSVVTDGKGGDFYKLVNARSGLVLEIEYESPEDGAAELQRAYSEGREARHIQWRPVFVKGDKGISYY